MKDNSKDKAGAQGASVPTPAPAKVATQLVHKLMKNDVVTKISVPITERAVVIIETEQLGKDHNIVRSEKQILNDLRQSFLINEEQRQTLTLESEEIRELLMRIQDGEFTCSVRAAKADKGSTYVVDENSSEYAADPTTLGQLRERKRSQAVVERGEFIVFRTASDFRKEKLEAQEAAKVRYGNKFAAFANKLKPVATAEAPVVQEEEQSAENTAV